MLRTILCCTHLPEEPQVALIDEAVPWGREATERFVNLESVTRVLVGEVVVRHQTASAFVLCFVGGDGTRLFFQGEHVELIDSYEAMQFVKRLEADPERYPDAGVLMPGMVNLFAHG